MHKTILITGASRGIGFETAACLAQKTHRVIAVARSENELTTLQQTYPNDIEFVVADLTDPQSIKTITDYIAGKSSGIDALINNAGALINKPFLELTEADWRHMLDVNLLSAVNLTKAMVPFLNPQSHIINISSMGGFQGSDKFPGLTAYSVAKGAIGILSECLAVELAAQKIRVNALCLGSVQTGMFEEAFPDFKAAVTPNDMGTYIADFALNGSTFYNGKVLPVALSNPS